MWYTVIVVKEARQMSEITLRVLWATVAAVLLAGVLAACGVVDKQKPVERPESPVSVDEVLSDVLPTGENEAVTDISLVTEAPEATDTAEVTTTYETAPWMKVDYSQKIVDTAIAQLGVPFEMGGSSPEEGFDAPGLTYYCVNEAGIEFPRSIAYQLEAGERVAYDDLAAGDLVYFAHEVGGEAKFCGVYVGGGLIIYSPVPDEFVKTANITTNYWVSHFVTGLRVTAGE